MTLRNLPEAKTFQRPKNFQWDAPSDVLALWSETPQAAENDSENTITMFEMIGEEWWSGKGVTTKRISAALRSIGNNDVTVQINSPGGDMFEGIAIYNMLRKHPAKVTIEVLGWAASAASIIAMAGDEIKMGLGSFMMVHNAWGMAIGNRHDFRDAAEMFDGFDAAIIDIYEARTGMDRVGLEKLMDAETFMGPSQAVENGFADVVDNGIELPEVSDSQPTEVHAKRRMEALLAKTGMPRSERRKLINEIAGGTPDAAITVTPDADQDVIAAMTQLIDSMKS